MRSGRDARSLAPWMAHRRPGGPARTADGRQDRFRQRGAADLRGARTWQASAACVIEFWRTRALRRGRSVSHVETRAQKMALKGCPLAETKSTHSNPARAGSNREQARKGTAVGAGSGGRGGGLGGGTGGKQTLAPIAAPARWGGRAGRRPPHYFNVGVSCAVRNEA